MTKRSKRTKKKINSSIDDEYIDSYIAKTKEINPDSLLKYDTIGKLSLKDSKQTETIKSKHFKNKNSPEVARLKKLRRKVLLGDNMLLDSDSITNQTSDDTNTINNTTNDLINLVDDDVDKEVDDIWNDSIFTSEGKKINKIKNINQLIPAVELPHPGQSYNPRPDDYVSLVTHSANIVNLNNKDHLSTETLPNRNKNIFERSSTNGTNGIKQETPSESDSSNEDDEVDEVSMSRKKDPKRKTRTERNKIKLLKEETRKKLVIKSIKKLKNDVDHIKKLNTTINKLTSTDKKENKIKRFKQYLTKLIVGEIPTKIGNKTFYSDPPEVNLEEKFLKENDHVTENGLESATDDTISIKNIKSVDQNPIKNVYKSIYRRGLLPPPPLINSRYKNAIKRLFNRRYIYKSVLSN